MIDRRALLTAGVALGALMATSKFSEAETMTTTTTETSTGASSPMPIGASA